MEEKIKDLKVTIRSLNFHNLDEICTIENMSFSLPWSKKMWHEELTSSIQKYYLAAKTTELEGDLPKAEKLIGYGGFRLIHEEANIVNLAVHPEYRKKGVGRKLLISLLKLAKEKLAEIVTLEVRASNMAAKKLYERYDFFMVAIRKKYYNDNNEDAYVYIKKLQ